MKQGRFITCRRFETPVFPPPWENGGPSLGFNSYQKAFEPYGGILYFRKAFTVTPEITRVLLTTTALGIYDLFLNGERVGEVTENGVIPDEYKPGWTDYHCRVMERTYDITSLCHAENELTVEVSVGWWGGRISYGCYGFPRPAFCGELALTDVEGNTVWIASDADWQTTVAGPVLRADIWDGEYYDARIPHPARHPEAHTWEDASFLIGKAVTVEEMIAPSSRPKPHLARRPLTAKLACGTEDNGTPFGRLHLLAEREGEGCECGRLLGGQRLILDVGQNLVGRPVLRLKAARGTRMEIFFAEMTNDSGDPARGNDGPEGSLYLANYRSAMSRIVYLCHGDGEESYFPTHSFFGFRYLELQVDGEVELLSVTAEVIGADLKETGSFVCDNEEINALYRNIVWGMRGNYLSHPTDCPQRDERLGWTCDTQLFCGAASYLANVDTFLRQWMGDVRASQIGHDGAVCDVIPRIFSETNNGNSAWADAIFLVPYRLYLMYGDTAVLEENYHAMEAYMRWQANNTPPGGIPFYGDWLAYGPTDKQYIATAYYAYDALLMAKISRILGKKGKATYYDGLFAAIRRDWQTTYAPNGTLTERSQTAAALAIAFELAEGELLADAIEALKTAIVANDHTLTTGFVGTALLHTALGKAELHDLGYSLLCQTKDPSWLYSLRQGATTLWERWNSYTAEKGFGDVNMNSFNHYAYGAVAQWFYEGICGICPCEDTPAFRRFLLAPSPDLRTESELPEGQKRIRSACATFDSPQGRIESAWEYTEQGICYRFTVPQGTEAELRILSVEGDTLCVNGKPLPAIRREARLCLTLAAGEYTVSTKGSRPLEPLQEAF